MGINKLLSIINYSLENLSAFENKTVGIDINNIAVARWLPAYKKLRRNIKKVVLHSEVVLEWIRSVLSFIDTLKNVRQIKLICVFDGKSSYDKIQHRIKKEQLMKQRIADRLTKAETDCLIEELVIDDYARLSLPSSSDFFTLRQILVEKGYVCYQALGESDRLLASLSLVKNHKHRCDAIFSADSDLLALLCPCLIKCYETNRPKNTKFSRDFKNVGFQVYRLKSILKKLGLTSKQFTDVCILLGCDYNQSPSITVTDAIHQLKKYKSFEMFPENEKNKLETINYEQCREIFTIDNPSEEIEFAQLLIQKSRKND